MIHKTTDINFHEDGSAEEPIGERSAVNWFNISFDILIHHFLIFSTIVHIQYYFVLVSGVQQSG